MTGGATVTVTPSSSGVSNAQPLMVGITASSTSGTPSGTVVLSSGNYATHPLMLANGAATLTLPAGVLALGTDTLTVAYTSTDSSMSAIGSATVTVTSAQAPAPTVTATPVSYATAGNPFKAIPLNSGQVLVSVAQNSIGIQLFTPSASGLSSTCVNSLSPSLLANGASALGMTLFPNGANVALAIDNAGIDFFSTAAITACSAMGTGVYVSQGSAASGQGSFASAISLDGQYAFVANEYGVAVGATTPGNIGVVALAYDAAGNISTSSKLLGQISTGGNAIAGVTLSPDGTRLYVTSEIATTSAPTTAGTSNPILGKSNCVQQNPSNPAANGLLTVIDTAKAEASPGASAIITTVAAGCSPVRTVETTDNTTLYVAARGDNRVLVFSTGMLELNAGNALLGYADTGGASPVGLQLFHGQKLLAVANSNRFGTGSSANATVLDVSIPTSPALVQTISTGLFPRELSLAADDSTLYLTNYDSKTLEVITTSVH